MTIALTPVVRAARRLLEVSQDVGGILNIERDASNILRRGGFTEQVKNGRGEGIRPFGAILVEASKMAEERRPSIPVVV